MPHGTQKSSQRWSLTFHLPEEPRCPGCAEFMQPIVVTVRHGWAWCGPCVQQGLADERTIAFALRHETMRRHAIQAHGILFYVPEPIAGRVQCAFEHYEAAVADGSCRPPPPPLSTVDFYGNPVLPFRYQLTAEGHRALD